MEAAISDQEIGSPVAGCRYGPTVKVRSGTRSPQARTPPAKFKAARRGPMMYPTPRYAGLMSGQLKVVAPPVMVVATFGLVLVLRSSFFPMVLMGMEIVFENENRLI